MLCYGSVMAVYNMLMVSANTKKTKQTISVAITVFVVLALTAAAWLKRGQLSESLAVIKTVPVWTLGLLAGLFITTMAFAALAYFYLSLKPLRYRELLLVEFAAAGINRLVPSGVGSLSVHGVYLHRHKHDGVQLTAVVGTNNMIGIMTHLILLATFLIVWPNRLRVDVLRSPADWVPYIIGLMLLAVIIFTLPKIRQKLTELLKRFMQNMRVYARAPHKPVLAAVASTGITVINVTMFGLAAHAVGVRIDPIALFFVYSAGVLVGTATPTPGGLGGVEAGLIAGLMAYGNSSTLALAAALTFRLATYWLPILIGLPAFVLARKQQLI